jgi:hypothetical protein
MAITATAAAVAISGGAQVAETRGTKRQAKHAAGAQREAATRLAEEEEKKKTQAAQLIKKRRGAIKERGARETILTSPLGLTTPSPTAGKTLLGQ